MCGILVGTGPGTIDEKLRALPAQNDLSLKTRGSSNDDKLKKDFGCRGADDDFRQFEFPEMAKVIEKTINSAKWLEIVIRRSEYFCLCTSNLKTCRFCIFRSIDLYFRIYIEKT